MVPQVVKSQLAKAGWQVHEAIPVGGGCITQAARVDTNRGPLFLKWGNNEVARTFPPEAKGLEALKQAAHNLHIPTVYEVFWSPEEQVGFLAMEWIHKGEKRASFWEDFGHGLAEMHRFTAERYGFESDNFIGRMPQYNRWHTRWPDFFRENRLLPQMQWARERGYWRSAWELWAERLLGRLEEYLPEAPPASLVHGDLWSGNVLVTESGTPALVDPAVYYGHREVDLAMTRLFGGFAPRFYEAYQEAWPLEPGYREREELYNLYHLLNHLNLFGWGYASGVERVLKAFGA